MASGSAATARQPIRPIAPRPIPPHPKVVSRPVQHLPRPTPDISALGPEPWLLQPALVPPVSSVEPAPRSLRNRRRRRDLVIGVTIGLCVTLGTTGYVLRSRQAPVSLTQNRNTSESFPVRLQVKPLWAEVKIDGLDAGSPDESGVLRLSLPGEVQAVHWLEVTAKGYHSIRRPLSILGGVSDVAVELIQKPFELVLTTQPPGAEVIINGEVKGISPATITVVPWETAELAVRHPGFREIRQALTPPTDSEKLEMNLVLEPSTVMVRIESEPLGAQVEIDGHPSGITPLELALEPSYLGKEIQVAASLDGFERKTQRLQVPRVPDNKPLSAHLDLRRPKSRLTIQTDPPGAQVVVNGKNLGPAPAVAEFEPELVGRAMTIEGRLPGSHAGRITAEVPPAGDSRELTVKLGASAQRVVFVLLSPTGTGSDHISMLEHLVDRIHELEPDQHFAVLCSSVESLRAWPAADETAAATSDQKIRAYDMVRAIRPSARGSLGEALDAALEYKPNSVWLFASGRLSMKELERFGETCKEQKITPNVIRSEISSENDRLEAWATPLGGSLHVLGQEGIPALAKEANELD